MVIKDLLEWQWQGYVNFHQSRSNLLIHIIAVPVFILAFALFWFSVLHLQLTLTVTAVLCMLVSILLQGIGHKKEQLPPEPFTGAKNAVLRIVLEQLYTFPKFVLTGGWLSAFKRS